MVLPAYDEETRLPIALETLADFFADAGLAAQLIVADDGSRDATYRIAREMSHRLKSDRLRVDLVRINHRGKGAAVRAGMALARAETVGYCDTDMSAGPDAIEAVYAALKGGADVAIASRGLPESILPVRQPWYRERAGRTFNLLLRKSSGIPFADTQCGLKLFRKEAADQIFRHQRIDGFAFDAELIVLALRLGYSVEEVPITWSHAQGSKISLVRDSWRMARDMLNIVRRLRRGELYSPGVPSDDAMQTMTTSEEKHWWHLSKRRLVIDTLEAHDCHGPCLDIGCGGGATMAAVARTMPVFGIDLSPHSVSFASARGLSAVMQAEASDLPFAAKSFGTVLALDVVEHHPWPEKMLRQVHRVLVVNGALIVTVPAFQWMWSQHDHILGHYRRYTKPQIRAELEHAGFEVVRTTYFHSWLLPLAWVFRKIRNIVGRGDRPDDAWLPGPLNRLFSGVATLERRALSGRDLPFGLSLLAVARRPDGSGRLAGGESDREDGAVRA